MIRININNIEENLSNMIIKLYNNPKKEMKIKENEIEIIDKAILCLGIIEMNNKMAPRTVVIDECIRLTKKFSNPESYKFINASLDKI